MDKAYGGMHSTWIECVELVMINAALHEDSSIDGVGARGSMMYDMSLDRQ